jgi:hypothetical protein
MPRRARSVEEFVEDFWERVAIAGETECWLWLGAVNGDGYPILRDRYGLLSTGGRVLLRDVLEVEIAGLVACHTCDLPPCLNPAHLWPGTQLENVRDMIAKGRYKLRERLRAEQRQMR